jgi:chromosome segregation ATPase
MAIETASSSVMYSPSSSSSSSSAVDASATIVDPDQAQLRDLNVRLHQVLLRRRLAEEATTTEIRQYAEERNVMVERTQRDVEEALRQLDHYRLERNQLAEKLAATEKRLSLSEQRISELERLLNNERAERAALVCSRAHLMFPRSPLVHMCAGN